MSSSATTRQLCLLRQRVATNDLLMRLLRHDLRLVAGDYHLQRVASDDKGLRPHQRVAIVVNSAESLATNFNDAVAIVVDSAESLATNFNDAVAIVMDSAESLATNFNDARLSSRPAESSDGHDSSGDDSDGRDSSGDDSDGHDSSGDDSDGHDSSGDD